MEKVRDFIKKNPKTSITGIVAGVLAIALLINQRLQKQETELNKKIAELTRTASTSERQPNLPHYIQIDSSTTWKEAFTKISTEAQTRAKLRERIQEIIKELNLEPQLDPKNTIFGTPSFEKLETIWKKDIQIAKLLPGINPEYFKQYMEHFSRADGLSQWTIQEIIKIIIESLDVKGELNWLDIYNFTMRLQEYKGKYNPKSHDPRIFLIDILIEEITIDYITAVNYKRDLQKTLREVQELIRIVESQKMSDEKDISELYNYENKILDYLSRLEIYEEFLRQKKEELKSMN
ncbi:MAG TPA: hypothetical protein VJI68_00155 [Candidatus Nanoarchaeia archaeon]|nr:hypothetical protein [Candidatus Nanoarchaeia archaeon]